MPTVTLTEYECRRGLLPPVCAKCGVPATDRVLRRPRKLPQEVIWLWGFPFLTTAVVCPPLFAVLFVLIGRRVDVRVPMCADHKHDWAWRDRASRWLIFPVWSVAATALTIFAALDPNDRWLYLGSAVLVFLMNLYVTHQVIGRGEIQVVDSEGMNLRIRNVHPEFAAAFEAERERDLAGRPARYHRFGDERDDYDDEPDEPVHRREDADAADEESW